MFWKVELDKEGSILSCEAVESKGRSGALIAYIEAETKALACSGAKTWHETRKRKALAYSERVRNDRAKSGKCTNHGCKMPCRRCSEKNARYRERKATGTLLKPWHETAEQALEAKRTAQRRFARMLIDIRMVQARLNELGPERFREWLRLEVDAREKSQPVFKRRPGMARKQAA